MDVEDNSLVLLDLPPELLTIVLRFLSCPPDVLAFGGCSTTCWAVVRGDSVWAGRLAAHFPDTTEPQHGSVRRSFLGLMCGAGITRCPCVPGCGDSLVTGQGRRCPCVVARCSSLRLKLGSLAPQRSGTSALSGGGFEGMLNLLRASFSFEHRELQVFLLFSSKPHHHLCPFRSLRPFRS